MKNLTIFFILALLTSTVQSQSLTEKEITGTWQVINVVDAGKQSQQADDMLGAYFDFYPDHNFQLRTKNQNDSSKGYKYNFENYKWSYNEVTQTIELSKGTMTIKLSKSNGKMFFELPETGVKLEVVMPM